VFRKVFISEEYSLPDCRPQFIIDAGANVGISAVYFAYRYPEATIFCIEPEASNAAQLRKNTAAYPNIRLIQGALWSRNARLTITNPEAEKVSFVTTDAATTVGRDSIPGFTVADLLAQSGHQQIDILKIDIEGSEAQVFAGDVDPWLAKVRVLLIELHENKAPGCGRTFFSAVTRHPFEYRQQGENVLLTRQGMAA
jgi:FkbM family methyltransferase